MMMPYLLSDPPLAEEDLREFSKMLPRCSPAQDLELSKNFHSLLENLIATAYDPSLHIGHRGAAINALCSFIGRAKTLGDGCRLDQDIWFRIFAILLDRSDTAKTKPLRQLLSCLVQILQYYDGYERNAIKDRALKDVLQVLLFQSDHVKAKPALQILSFFISKGVITISRLEAHLVTFRKQPAEHQETLTGSHGDLAWLLQVLFEWVGSQEASIPAGQAACGVVRSMMDHDQVRKESKSIHHVPVWAAPLNATLRKSFENLTNFRSHLLPDLFESDVCSYMSFLEQLGLPIGFSEEQPARKPLNLNQVNSAVLFMCLEVGKEAGVVLDTGTTSTAMMYENEAYHRAGNAEVQFTEVKENKIYLPESIITQAIEDVVNSVRLSGLALIIATPSQTRPLSQQAFMCLQHNIPHLFLETDANVRGEVLVFFQRLIDRIQAVLGTLVRTVTQQVERQSRSTSSKLELVDQPAEIVERHQNFIRWFVRFLRTQLHPSAAYQRHITGLRSLIILVRSGLDDDVQRTYLSKHVQGDAKWSFHESLFDAWVTRSLQDLLMDPFDDVRSFAASLLLMHPNATALLHDCQLNDFIARAEHMMLRSGRADHADGVSRAYALLFETVSSASKICLIENLVSKLEQTITLANQDLAEAVNKFPMHGILASLRFILETPACYDDLQRDNFAASVVLHRRIVSTLQDVWISVRDILCNDAPEGHVPDDLEDVSINTKDILSYCWRALKEASSLLRVLVLKAPVNDEAEKAMLSPQQFKELCRLTFTELAELRHRGAFSNVAQSFAGCCFRAQSLQYNDLLRELYNDTLECIREKGSSTTRRSAGLPSLMVGILSAAPASTLFKDAINDLLDESRKPTQQLVAYNQPLPQVHTLNCLRSIFINTILGNYTEPYIAPVLTLAGECLTSNIWAIRNCGLMLFRALIDRLLGSSDSQNWSEDSKLVTRSRFSYGDFPRLLEIVIELLSLDLKTLESSEAALESVFPALKMIQRIPPPRGQKEKICNLVLNLCASPHWHVRDMAARTYTDLISKEDVVERVRSLVPPFGLGQNATHGRLLCISYLARKVLSSGCDRISRFTQDLQDASIWLLWENPCPFTRALYLEVLNQIGFVLLEKEFNISDDSSWMQFNSWSIPSSNEVDLIASEFAPVQEAYMLHILIRYMLWRKLGPLHHDYQNPSPSTNPIRGPLNEFLLEMISTHRLVLLHVLDIVIRKTRHLPYCCIEPVARVLLDSPTKEGSYRLLVEANDLPQELALHRSLLAKLYAKYPSMATKVVMPWHHKLVSAKFVLPKKISLPPFLIEISVQLWGIMMNVLLKIGGAAMLGIHEHQTIVDTLPALIREDQSFDTRVAVARSLAAMPLVLRETKRKEMMLFKLKLLVYDLLNDDDEDIRILASKAASDIMFERANSSEDKVVVPLLASQRLIDYFFDEHVLLEDLSMAAITRMTGSSLIGGRLLPSASDTVKNAVAENTALFAVEKQNLFIDQVREAMLWSHALKRLPSLPNRSGPFAFQHALGTWAVDAVRCLVEKARSQRDGPLGWTSKPDVFTFGMRVFCAADVLFSWAGGFTIELERELANSLETLLVVGREQKLHEMWLAKIENVLVANIKRTMKNSKAAKNVVAISAALQG